MSYNGAGSPFLRAPSLTRSGCSRMKLRLSMAGTQTGEQDHVADRGLVREDRDQPVHPEAPAARRWEAVSECGEEVLVHLMRLLITGGACPRLVSASAPLSIA